MPKRPACTGTSDANVTTDICVYYKPAKYRGGHPSIYLRTDSLDWLLSYAADEHHFQGVARSDPAKSAQRPANCPAVADLRLTWDFDGKAWDAEFVAGTFEGIRTRVEARNITQLQWDKMQSMSVVEGDLAGAHIIRLKAAAKHLITQWCDAITRDARDAFEREWGLTEPTLETPQKRRKTRQGPMVADADADPAVADADCSEIRDAEGMAMSL